jgi:sigma-B regulation protein RsbU (phosphoserine phosphatase)
MRSDADPTTKTAVADAVVRHDRTRGILTVTSGDEVGRVIAVPHAEIVTLGRSEECTERFLDSGLSRVHARVVRVGGAYVLKDLGSTNGSFVNDVRVEFAAELKDGDRVRLGPSTALRFTLVDEAEERALKLLFEGSRRDGFIAALESLEDKANPLREDLLQACEFQRRALPEPPRLPGVDVEVLYRPLDLVGGDLYHVTTLGERGLRVFIADSTGHGIKASLTTMVILTEYELVKRRPDPADVLRELNHRVAATYAHLGVRFTAMCLDLDFDRQRLSYSSAAHPPAFILRGASHVELESSGTFVGLVDGATYARATVALERGDRVVIFTDGATEQMSPAGDVFGEARLLHTLSQAFERQTPVGEALAWALERFVGIGRTLEDDVTLVTVSWTGHD